MNALSQTQQQTLDRDCKSDLIRAAFNVSIIMLYSCLFTIDNFLTVQPAWLAVLLGSPR